MSLKVFNESLDRYCKSILKEEKEVFHNDNGEDYEIIERSKTGSNALLKHPSGRQWIIAWNCPSNNRGSWGQGHYFFDEEEAREVWEDKYKNESLSESIKNIINKLNEAQMSDEDKHDSDILRDIYNKTQQRSNAKLTPEEKEVLDKYGLERNAWSKTIVTKPFDSGRTLPIFKNSDKKYIFDINSEKINYADRARKIVDRDRLDRRYGDNRVSTAGVYDMYNGDNYHSHSKEFLDMYGNFYGRNNYQKKERAAQDTALREPIRNMSNALRDRKYNQSNLDSIDAEKDKKLAKLEREKQDVLRHAEWSKDYHSKQLDSANKRINKLLKRDKKEESLKENRSVNESLNDKDIKYIVSKLNLEQYGLNNLHELNTYNDAPAYGYSIGLDKKYLNKLEKKLESLGFKKTIDEDGDYIQYEVMYGDKLFYILLMWGEDFENAYSVSMNFIDDEEMDEWDTSKLNQFNKKSSSKTRSKKNSFKNEEDYYLNEWQGTIDYYWKSIHLIPEWMLESIDERGWFISWENNKPIILKKANDETVEENLEDDLAWKKQMEEDPFF